MRQLLEAADQEFAQAEQLEFLGRFGAGAGRPDLFRLCRGRRIRPGGASQGKHLPASLISNVIPAQAGIHSSQQDWTPALTGMTHQDGHGRDFS